MIKGGLSINILSIIWNKLINLMTQTCLVINLLLSSIILFEIRRKEKYVQDNRNRVVESKIKSWGRSRSVQSIRITLFSQRINNCIEQSFSWEVYSHSTDQEIPLLF
jgi:hypothetical protein